MTHLHLMAQYAGYALDAPRPPDKVLLSDRAAKPP